MQNLTIICNMMVNKQTVHQFYYKIDALLLQKTQILTYTTVQ